MTGSPFNRDEWWAAENAARLREEDHRAEQPREYRHLQEQINDVFKGHSVATRVTVLAHLMVEAVALSAVLPGNVLEAGQFKEMITMLKKSLDFMSRVVIPKKMEDVYGIRLAVRVKSETHDGKNPS